MVTVLKVGLHKMVSADSLCVLAGARANLNGEIEILLETRSLWLGVSEGHRLKLIELGSKMFFKNKRESPNQPSLLSEKFCMYAFSGNGLVRTGKSALRV